MLYLYLQEEVLINQLTPQSKLFRGMWSKSGLHTNFFDKNNLEA
jgi:hypothetical protein